MPAQSALRLIKRARLYARRGDFKWIPAVTRGIYVLYRRRVLAGRGRKTRYDVAYIGVAGVAHKAKTGIGGSLRRHDRKKKGWTHYSVFEVHDNVTREEILELEGLLLRIFRHDPRIELSNKQFGGKAFKRLAARQVWKG